MPLQFSTWIYGQTTKANCCFSKLQLCATPSHANSKNPVLLWYSVGASEVYSSALAWEGVSHNYSNQDVCLNNNFAHLKMAHTDNRYCTGDYDCGTHSGAPQNSAATWVA